MPHTATTSTSVSTLAINMKERMSLEKLLLAAKIDDDDGTAIYAWTSTNRTIDRPFMTSGVEVYFFQHHAGRRLLDHMTEVLYVEQLKALTAHEVFCLAAANPTQFEELLRVGPIVITTPLQPDRPSPFMLICLNDGRILLRRVERSADFQGCQFAGICFTPIRS